VEAGASLLYQKYRVSWLFGGESLSLGLLLLGLLLLGLLLLGLLLLGLHALGTLRLLHQHTAV